jgi:hypothetical protein
LWAGWWDQYSEGTFTDMNDISSKLNSSTYKPWGLGEPNGNQIENCAEIAKSQEWKWNDISCERTACVICKIDFIPNFIMRGQ